MLDQFDCPSMIRLFAGRPRLVLSGERDPIMVLGGAKLAFASAERAFELASAKDKLQIDVAPGAGHEITFQQHLKAIEWLNKNLK